MRSAYEKRPKPMSGKNDISSLFKIIKENPDEYQEIVENEDAIKSRERWPLLSALPTTILGNPTTEPLLKRSSSDLNRSRKTSPANQVKQAPKPEPAKTKPVQEFFTTPSLEDIPSLKGAVRTLKQDPDQEETLSNKPIFINRAAKNKVDSASIDDKPSKSKPLQEFFDPAAEEESHSLRKTSKTLEQEYDHEEAISEKPSLKKFVLTKIPTIKRKKAPPRPIETFVESPLNEEYVAPIKQRSAPAQKHTTPINANPNNSPNNENQLSTIFERLKAKEVESEIEDKRSLFERLRRP